MKNSIKFFICVVVAVVAFDMLFGCFADQYIKKHPLPGDYRLIDYVVNQCDEECIIVGNSLAINSLIPSIIEDSLDVSCYNAGASAQHIPYVETIMKCIVDRYTPKMIIFVFGPTFLSGTGNGQRFNILIPFYQRGHEIIDRNLERKDFYEPYFLHSSLYRFNRIWWRILLYHFISYSDNNDKGFVAHNKPSKFPELYPLEYKSNSKERKECFIRCLDICKNNGIEMVCVSPPVFKTFNKGVPQTIQFIKKMCEQNNVIFIDDTQDTTYLNNAELWYDNVHFNIDGSRLYTVQFIRELKEIQKQN
ncbi:MAG: hypothetical protein J6S96_06995 [Muribaculaceae bacterium]|nr:hypothetical protein [Muribaculaceae bacterium]